MHAPTEAHWKAVKCIPRYLKHTTSLGILLTRDTTFDFQCFSASDWGWFPDDRRSTLGYAIYLGKDLVSCVAKKNPTIAYSSTESEYKAIANTTSYLL